MKRDALPAFEKKGVKLYTIGIGKVEAARELCSQVGFPAEQMLVDDSEYSQAYSAAGTRNSGRDTNGKQIFEGFSSMWSPATNNAIKTRGRDDLNSILPLYSKANTKVLMPTDNSGKFSVERTLVQGGAFVFSGKEALLEFYDTSSGAHVDLNEFIDVAVTRKGKK